MPERTCSVEGCNMPHRARGLCSTHYNQTYCPDRHKRITVKCGWCGKACEKAADASRGYGDRFCSHECQGAMYAYRAGDDRCEVSRFHPAHPGYRPPLPVLWVAPPAHERAPRVFVGGICVRCGSSYLAEDYTNSARYCSLRCSRRVNKQRYRARKHAAYEADVSPRQIYDRDGWRCQVKDCRMKSRRVARTKAVPHPRAPVLDHIVPLAKGGKHEPSNVQCAHFLCNSVKSARLDDVQLMLFG